MAANPKMSGTTSGVNVHPVTLEELRHRAKITKASTNAAASTTKSGSGLAPTIPDANIPFTNPPSITSNANLLVDPVPGRPIEKQTPPTPPIACINSAAALGRLIRASREQLKLSQQQFADVAGVGRRFISELENGKATLEFDRVLQVCKAAGIDLHARQRSAQ
jgi:y4mF family transcriptional regulator